MFWFKNKRNVIDEEIERLVNFMRDVDPGTDGYGTMAANLVKLTQARMEKARDGLDLNVVVSVAGSLIGTIMVLKFEKFDILTTKAVGWLIKPRI